MGLGLAATGAISILLAVTATLPIAPASQDRDCGTPSIEGWRGLLLGQPLDLSRAKYVDLLSLPAVGPRTASSLIKNREMVASEPERLTEVPGIGKVKYLKLRGWFASSR